MHARIKRFGLSVASLAVIAATACAEVGVPTESTLAVSSPLTSTTSTDRLDAIATFDRKPSITIAWAKKWIGPEGGRLDFQGFAVDVPPGAVAKVTQFSIQLPVDPKGSERVLAKFGPHGATFAVPVTIEFPYRGTSIFGSGSAKVLWWNGSAWVDMGGSPTADGTRLRTATDHFSEYGTSEGRGGVITSGG